ncbi:cytochrome c oxidase assembly protein [Jatrophihabitans sp. DSM 45814]
MPFLEVQPVLLLVCAGALVWYVKELRALPAERRWPRHRTMSFMIGLVLVLVATDAGIASDTRRLFWVWLTQALLLLLVLPIPLLVGQPVELARQARRPGPPGPPGPLVRFADSAFGRVCASPIVGAGLIPIACVLFLFGPIPGWSIRDAGVGWTVQTAMLIVGLIIVLPLVSNDITSSSLAISAAVAVGFVELLLDAVPGIVMRLSTHPVTNFFEYRTVVAGQRGWLSDQQFAGGILWCVAELLDLPFLILIFRRWVQADAREAALIDAELVDSMAVSARDMPPAGDAAPSDAAEGTHESNQPWFMTDPQLRDRFRSR